MSPFHLLSLIKYQPLSSDKKSSAKRKSGRNLSIYGDLLHAHSFPVDNHCQVGKRKKNQSILSLEMLVLDWQDHSFEEVKWSYRQLSEQNQTHVYVSGPE